MRCTCHTDNRYDAQDEPCPWCIRRIADAEDAREGRE